MTTAVFIQRSAVVAKLCLLLTCVALKFPTESAS